MTQIDKTKPVLVTGATGYVASWLVKQLLEEGITVHAAVRNPDNKNKVAHLDEIAAKTKSTANAHACFSACTWSGEYSHCLLDIYRCIYPKEGFSGSRKCGQLQSAVLHSCRWRCQSI